MAKIQHDLGSSLERSFDTHFIALGHDLPKPVSNFRFATPRKWEFDRAWPEYKVAVELEGTRPRPIKCHNCGSEVRARKGDGSLGAVIRVYGWHQRFSRFKSDKEKYNAAVRDGWFVLRFIHDDVNANPFEMVEAIREVINSRKHGVPVIESLTEREDQILHLMAAGFTGPEMAERLNLAEMTVKAHIGKIRTKLIVRNRASAVARAACWGMLDLSRIPWPDESPELMGIFDDREF
ncbi:MAG: helix-turn-helix transcriptional regulator [Thermoplasmata archaeon]|nr:helix-turn-helix transcriptional regulator [Thermoplasmata archaeon]